MILTPPPQLALRGAKREEWGAVGCGDGSVQVLRVDDEDLDLLLEFLNQVQVLGLWESLFQ